MKSAAAHLSRWAREVPCATVTPVAQVAAEVGLSIDQLLNLVNPAFNGPDDTMLVWDNGLAVQVGGSSPHLLAGQLTLFP